MTLRTRSVKRSCMVAPVLRCLRLGGVARQRFPYVFSPYDVPFLRVHRVSLELLKMGGLDVNEQFVECSQRDIRHQPYTDSHPHGGDQAQGFLGAYTSRITKETVRPPDFILKQPP